MIEKIEIDGVELILQTPDEIPNMQWIGQEIYMSQLLAAWLQVDPERDLPMNPQILGKPGVGKTTLAYSAATNLDLPTYIFQCTVDTRPEDLLISPVISTEGTIQYHASALVSAMIKGGVCILDEANRMAEKSWASLAPLLDARRYVESIIAGIKIPAHSSFRIVCTMNEDSSTFEIPEYIHSRLQPQIFIDFPDRNEEIQILKFNLPFARKDVILYAVNFLQNAHVHNKGYTIRDGINICRYYLKLEAYSSKKGTPNESINKEEPIIETDKTKTESEFLESLDIKLFYKAIGHILGPDAQEFYRRSKDSKEIKKMNQKFRDMFDQLNSVFFENKVSDDDIEDDSFADDIDDLEYLDEEDEDEALYLDDPENLEDYDDDEIEESPRNRKARKDDKIIRIVEEKDIDQDNVGSKEDPNEMIRKFLKRREHERKKKKQNKSDKNDSTSSESKDD